MCNIYRIEDDKKSSVVTFLPVKSISEKFRNFINGKSENAEARKFLNEIIKYAPGKSKEPVVTIVYNQEDNSGTFKFSLQDWNFIDDFLYLADSLKTGNELITLTPIEYLRGNKKRKIIKHSTKTLTNLNEDDIKINFSDWIGDKEQNVAWEYLTIVRDVFEKMNLRYNPENPNTWIQKAWEEFYVAQNSKWFKWYQNNEKNTNDFRRDVDSNFRECLSRVFYYLNRAGFGLDVPEFPVLIQQEKKLKLDHPFESNPTINGRQDKIWASQGAYSADLDKTAEEDLIDRVFWGYDNDNIYFAIKSKKSSLEKAFKNNSLIMAVYSFPADVKRITVDEKMSNWGILRTSVKVKNSLDVFKFHKDSVTIASPDTTILVAVKNRFLELSIPLKKLKSKSENKKFFIQLWKDDKIEDY
ncbi:MAG: hypothetical protein KAR38_07330, partial [Calditrichia bacterium]|nr:hypothetical protein [Calditrichia bacterium]